jgi:hypothetical protein
MATPRRTHVAAQSLAGWIAAIALSCVSSSPPAHPDAGYLPKDVGLLLAESDGGAGSGLIEAIDPSTHALVQHRGTAFDEDPRLRRLIDPHTAAERFFLVGAATGQLTELARNGAIVAQWSVLDDGGVGQSASPRDVAIAADGSLWITRAKKPGLRVLEPDGRARRTVDLSAFAPADAGTDRAPGMTSIAIVGSTAYVALARPAADLSLTHDAQIVAIDTATYVVTPFVDVPMRGPLDRFVLQAPATDTASPRLWIACGGDAQEATQRGISAVDLDRKEIALALDWTTLGLSPLAFSIAGTHDGYAIAGTRSSGATAIAALVGFDPETPGSAVQTIFRSPDAPRLVDVAVANDLVFVAEADRSTPSVLVFDRFEGARRGVISTALPPLGMLVLRPPG